MLLFDQGCRSCSTWDSYQKIVAQAKQLVVPTLADFGQREMCEIGLLLLQQSDNQGSIDGDFRGRLCPDGHISPTSSHPSTAALKVGTPFSGRNSSEK